MKDPHEAASHIHPAEYRHDPNESIRNHGELATDLHSTHDLHGTDQPIRYHDAQNDQPERDDPSFNVIDKSKLHKPL
jgi:hypothetical protein